MAKAINRERAKRIRGAARRGDSERRFGENYLNLQLFLVAFSALVMYTRSNEGRYYGTKRKTYPEAEIKAKRFYV